MVMIKKALSVLLLFLFLPAAAGCSSNTKPAADTQQSASVPPEAAVAEAIPAPATPSAAAPAMSEAEQKALLMAHYDEWAFREVWESPWFYTFSDLDQNGRLEVISACLQGTGFYTYAGYWEVTSDFSGIAECPYELEEGGSFPDVIADTSSPVPRYYEASTGRYYYLYTDTVRGGAAEYYFGEVALCLHDGVIDLIPIASRYEFYSHGETPPQITYRNGAGEEITREAYANAVVSRFGTQAESVRFDWTMVENPMPEEEPAGSWMEETSSVPTEFAGPAVAITKNPTSEAIAIGGKTWFIAHADNAVSLTWLFVSPDGQTCSLEEARSAHPGLVLEALEGDTLAVSNVPVSFNGWGVEARFTGQEQGNIAVTEPAWLYVGDFVTAYGGVIEKYRAAYTSGNQSNPEYLWNNGISEICAYSSGVGYALKDLDKNGVPELLIAGMGTDDFSQGMAYDIYTLVNNVPVNLATSQARDRFYLRTDNTILNEGSGGAGFSSIELYRLSGETLTPVEGVKTFFPGDGRDGYYLQTGSFSYEPQAGDARITEAQFHEKVSAYEGKIFVPPLTRIA